MTSRKYWYYIDSIADALEIGENKLIYSFNINEDTEGFWIKQLEGSFILRQPYFDYLVSLIGTDIPFSIYEGNSKDLGGTQIYSGYITNINDFNYKTQTVTCKLFTKSYEGQQAAIMPLIDNEIFLSKTSPSGGEVKSVTYSKTIASSSCTLKDIIDFALLDIDFEFNLADIWLNTGFELEKLRLFNLSMIAEYGVNGSNKSLTLRRLFEIIEIIFRGYWYEDSGFIKFKTFSDFCGANVYDATLLTKHKYTEVYNESMRYAYERINLNQNNSSLAGDDWINKNSIVYPYVTEQKKEYDLKDITTRYVEGGTDYSLDGFFIAYVNPETGNLIQNEGAKTNVLQENADLSQANIIDTFYRDYIYSNRANYTAPGSSVITTPIRFRPFIEMPALSVILPSINTFYDSIKWYDNEVDVIICRVYKQSTDLNTGVTTFNSYQFQNSIN